MHMTSLSLYPHFQNAIMHQAGKILHKVCMFVLYENELVCVVREHKDGTASVEPPGGKIDIKPCGNRETAEEALRREAAEELNIEVRPLGLLGVEAHPHTGKLVGYYMCEHMSGEPVNNLEDEHLGVLRVPLQDLSGLKADCEQEKWGGRPVDYRIPDGMLREYLNKMAQDRRVLASFDHT